MKLITQKKKIVNTLLIESNPMKEENFINNNTSFIVSNQENLNRFVVNRQNIGTSKHYSPAIKE
jgi:hypothetical protein